MAARNRPDDLDIALGPAETDDFSGGGDEKTCPYCQTAVLPGAGMVVCEACGIPHHAECWRENGGCTTYGCTRQQHAQPPVRAAAHPAGRALTVDPWAASESNDTMHIVLDADDLREVGQPKREVARYLLMAILVIAIPVLIILVMMLFGGR